MHWETTTTLTTTIPICEFVSGSLVLAIWHIGSAVGGCQTRDKREAYVTSDLYIVRLPGTDSLDLLKSSTTDDHVGRFTIVASIRDAFHDGFTVLLSYSFTDMILFERIPGLSLSDRCGGEDDQHHQTHTLVLHRSSLLQELKDELVIKLCKRNRPCLIPDEQRLTDES